MFALLMLLAPFSLAVIETYEFDSEELRQRYQQFADELRCPKCQNQNLSGSNSAISEDLRRELHRLLQEGKSDQEITDYMVARYGEFILYKPPLNLHTAVLWAFPGLLFIVGAVVLVMLRRRPARQAQTEAGGDDLHRQAREVLARFDEDKP